MSDDLAPICPNCQSCQVVPLLSVLPGFPPYDTVDISRLTAAECVATQEMNTQWECQDCKTRWGGEEEPSRKG